METINLKRVYLEEIGEFVKANIYNLNPEIIKEEEKFPDYTITKTIVNDKDGNLACMQIRREGPKVFIENSSNPFDLSYTEYYLKA